MTGRVEEIHIAPAAGEPMRPLKRARAIAGRGLEGDRYAAGAGHWSAIHRSGDSLTLVAAEDLEAAATAGGVRLEPGVTRRNVTTRGVALAGLVGRTFRIGPVRCRGVRLCQPCSYLDDLVELTLLPALVHRGGIRAEILADGLIAVGDPVEALDPTS